MLMDVTAQMFQQGTRRTRTLTVTVDADGGDDAVAQAMVKLAGLSEDETYKIVAVLPAAATVPPELAPPMAGVEGADDAPQDEGEPDERAALIQQAIDEGVAVDRRWGVARIRAALDAAKVAEAAE